MAATEHLNIPTYEQFAKLLTHMGVIANAIDINDVYANRINDTASGTIASFTDGADDFPVRDLTVQMKPIQAGSGDPSPDNVRPISGRTGVTVTRTGKNLLSNNINDYSVYGVYRYLNDVVPQNTQAIMSFVDKDTSISLSDISFGFVYGDVGTGSTAGTRWCINNGSVQGYTGNLVPSMSDVFCSNVILYPNTEEAFNKLFARYDIMVELGKTATAYEAPQIQQVTLPLGQTVYGGTVDVTTGVLTVTKKRLTTTWGAMGNQVDRGSGYLSRNIYVDDILASQQNDAICDLLIFRNDNSATPHYSITRSKYFVAYMQSNTPDTTALELVYELDTPIIYTLTPQQVTTLLGLNNIWSDSDSVSVEYVSDTKLYIDKKLESVNTLRLSIAPVEDGATASQSYAQGKYFFHNGNFCKAKTAIASGATFTLNTNYEVTTVAAELFSALN